MPKLDVFVPPNPWPAFSTAMNWVNRILMLHGIPGLRDIPYLNGIPGIRGLTGIRRIVIEPTAFDRLRRLVQSGEAVFMLPNHPEFFTDWMLDKEMIARAAPQAASWATNGVVNGMGAAMQKFWLWNNLIAQIPGDSSGPKAWSVAWALKGKGVLLHPEGMVGWHPDYIGPLMPGAADMAKECAEKSAKQSWLQPIVWKIVFDRDASSALSREAGYIEHRLAIKARPDLTPAERAHQVYVALADRELEALGLHVVHAMALSEKMETIRTVLAINLASWLGEEAVAGEPALLISKTRKRARDMKAKSIDASTGIALADRLQKHLRLGDFAFSKPTISQEETAAHLKRLRNDWCKGSLRDTINAYLPQPAGLRTTHIRLLDPVQVNAQADSRDVMSALRSSMQATLDEMIEDLSAQTGQYAQDNPFHHA